MRGREVRTRVNLGIEKWNAVRFITLTLKSRPDSLADRFAFIDKSFEKLRASDLWKDNVRAAIAIPEVTIGKQGQWHVHLHILADGKFIPAAQLKEEWFSCTGDSFVIDIQAVHNRSDASGYVAGYIAKPCSMSRWTDSQIREFADATHGRRMLRTYGQAKLPKLDEDDENDCPGPSTHLVHVNNLLRAEEHGSEHIRHAVDIISRLGHAHASMCDRDPPSVGLPNVTSQELSFATEVCEWVERQFPTIPDAGTLEDCRRRHFNQPGRELKPFPQYVQMSMDVMKPPRHL